MDKYPKEQSGKRIYVRYPVQIQEMDLPKVPITLTVGKWMAVNVLPKGYAYLPAPYIFDTKEQCQKACDVTNKHHGFTPRECRRIINKSMGLKKK